VSKKGKGKKHGFPKEVAGDPDTADDMKMTKRMGKRGRAKKVSPRVVPRR